MGGFVQVEGLLSSRRVLWGAAGFVRGAAHQVLLGICRRLTWALTLLQRSSEEPAELAEEWGSGVPRSSGGGGSSCCVPRITEVGRLPARPLAKDSCRGLQTGDRVSLTDRASTLPGVRQVCVPKEAGEGEL